ncbi:MAG: hypothetical protein HYZ90_02580, partial [Candidatus Omnitrophica bacterium]|nr:hypothetical protein [Candidatus Omnitrophota bacterium]
ARQIDPRASGGLLVRLDSTVPVADSMILADSDLPLRTNLAVIAVGSTWAEVDGAIAKIARPQDLVAAEKEPEVTREVVTQALTRVFGDGPKPLAVITTREMARALSVDALLTRMLRLNLGVVEVLSVETGLEEGGGQYGLLLWS